MATNILQVFVLSWMFGVCLSNIGKCFLSEEDFEDSMRFRRQVAHRFTPMTLYSDEDNIVDLNIDNFDSEVYGSSNVWLVEFYMSWCGHCQAFVPIWKDIGERFSGN